MKSKSKEENFSPPLDLNHGPLHLKASVLPLSYIDPPMFNLFQIPFPNKFKIVHMDIPIVQHTDTTTGQIRENVVFCADILDALTQDFFARKGNPVEEPPHIDEVKVSIFKCATICSKLLNGCSNPCPPPPSK